MASPPKSIPISSRALRMDTSELGRAVDEGVGGHGVGSPSHPARLSPTLTRSYDPTNPENLERQRTMDEDFAMQLSRARSASIALAHHPSLSQLRDNLAQSLPNSETRTESLNGMTVEEEEDDNGYFPLTMPENISGTTTGVDTPPKLHLDGIDPASMMSQGHDPSLLVSSVNSKLKRSGSAVAANRGIAEVATEVPPPFDSNPEQHPVHPQHGPATGGGIYRSQFDFTVLESFAADERTRLGLSTESDWARPGPRPRRFMTHPQAAEEKASAIPEETTVTEDLLHTGVTGLEQPHPRHRSHSQNMPHSKRPGGKLALFESAAASMPPFELPLSASPRLMSSTLPPATPNATERATSPPHIPPMPPPPHDYDEDKPYRFTFYSNSLRSTIHARSLSELPAAGQTFEELFLNTKAGDSLGDPLTTKKDLSSWKVDEDGGTWWMDVLSPNDDEMRVLSKCFGIHPLTAEDIQMEETREKIELFRNYYLVCFRSFDQDQYSPTYLEPINYYIVVFREGILSFHFRLSPHPQNVRRRIKQLKDYISVTSDWISYALIDDITDAFGPLIQSIEYEVDSIDELVLILKEAEQSDMLRRIGTCRKKVMGLLRLMGNKADVVKGLAKRCNENWSMAPKSDIGLYLSDIQDHLITMTQSLNHYEKLLSRSHSNYLAQISIEMTDANNQINDVLSRLTALGTILIPMNLITGLWGMNVHVPGQDIEHGYAWFIGIICFLVGIGGLGSWGAYRLMRRSRK